jgi:hypothetical protein
MRTPEEIALSKEKRTIYMREYKNREYTQKHDQMKEKQRIYYHTKHNNINIPTFPVMKLEFTKMIISLNKIRENHPEELKKFMIQYFSTENMENI